MNGTELAAIDLQHPLGSLRTAKEYTLLYRVCSPYSSCLFQTMFGVDQQLLYLLVSITLFSAVQVSADLHPKLVMYA